MSADVSVPKENAIHPDTTESETPVENFRPIKVIVVGAGFSGILLGIRLPQRIRNIDLTIYEKNDGIGGTWWENRYPGCACDVPCKSFCYLFGVTWDLCDIMFAKLTCSAAHSYQYSFEPNPLWSSYYSPAAEICDYLTTVAKKYSADRFIRCGHRVTKCDWNEATGRWSIVLPFEHEGYNSLITASR
jgi:cation diffusion facilitator CzcD-associated flavoprotein CzcO